MSVVAVIAGGVLGGASFWLRGSAYFEKWVGRGKTTADAVWAAILAALFYCVADPMWWQAAALGVALFVGGRPPWWKSLSMCRNPADGDCCWCLWLRHTARGILWTAPAALAAGLMGFDWIALAVAGLLVGPAYEVGWRAWPQRATEVGEVLFGAAIGVAVVLAGIA